MVLIVDLSTFLSTAVSSKKHSIHPLHVKETDVLKTFDFILRTMTEDLENEKQRGELKAKLSNLANTYVKNYKPSKYAVRKHGILKRLLKNNNIAILRPDKGNGTLIMVRDVYIRKTFETIKDRTKFQELLTDPTITREGQHPRFLRSMNNKKIFSKKTYEKIYVLVVLIRLLYMGHLKFTS